KPLPALACGQGADKLRVAEGVYCYCFGWVPFNDPPMMSPPPPLLLILLSPNVKTVPPARFTPPARLFAMVTSEMLTVGEPVSTCKPIPTLPNDVEWSMMTWELFST